MIVVGFLSIVVGGFVITAALMNWESFFKPLRKQFFVFELFGRGCARLVYGLFGLFLVVVGIAILVAG